MSLKEYKAKRDFKKTSEPQGKRHAKHQAIYVVQKHDASHLHYDFRLAINGVLKSWSIPKGPCLDPTIKRLAVETEDHPLEYADFEGVIPQQEYGGGTVMVWDYGHWQAENEEPEKAYNDGKITFTLKGKKLTGEWILLRTNRRPSKAQWLLIKKKDEQSKTLQSYDITQQQPNSAVTDRSLDEIVQKTRQNFSLNKKPTAPQQNKGLPKKFKPQLATLVKQVPKSGHWIYELKLDGYRLLSYIKGKKISLITRSGQDWTAKFPSIVNELQQMKLKDGILDGEIVALDSKGRCNFQLLQNAIKQSTQKNIHYYIFDIPFYDKKNLVNLPLIERKSLLQQVLADSQASARVHYCEHYQGEGEEFLKEVCEHKLEGLIAKRANSNYQQARSKDWLKIKCWQRQEFVIVGYTDPKGLRNCFGALLLAYYDENNNLIYCGNVGTGFTEKSLKEIAEGMHSLHQTKCPLSVMPDRPLIKEAHWLKPQLVAEVEFTEWTEQGYLRHPSFQGLREDKSVKEVIREQAEEDKVSQIDTTQGLLNKLTHPNKILFAEAGVTKLDLAKYYESVAERLLPHLKGRLVTLVRCPQDKQAQCFYQKHWVKGLTKSIGSIAIDKEKGKENYITIANSESLIVAAQLSILEFHPWASRYDNILYPDRLIFDLDPGPKEKWTNIVKSACIVREALHAIGLKSYPKLTGGKGIHVMAPIEPEYEFHTVKDFVRTFSTALAEFAPQLLTANLRKNQRNNKILIDYFRNDSEATAVAPFSPRANGQATLALPVSWEQLEKSKKRYTYTIKSFSTYCRDYPHDPWHDFFSISQSLKLNKFL